MPKDLKYSRLLDFYGELLTEKQCEVLGYYYNDDLSLSEISENLCITRQGALDIIHRAQAQLDLLESKLGLTRVEDSIDSACEILSNLIEKETDSAKCSELERALNILNN